MPVTNKEEAYVKIIEISENNDYATGSLLDYEYFSKHFQLIAIDLRKQIELENSDLKQRITFIGILEDDRDSKEIRTHNHLAHKQTLNHLTKE